MIEINDFFWVQWKILEVIVISKIEILVIMKKLFWIFFIPRKHILGKEKNVKQK